MGKKTSAQKRAKKKRQASAGGQAAGDTSQPSTTSNGTPQSGPTASTTPTFDAETPQQEAHDAETSPRETIDASVEVDADEEAPKEASKADDIRQRVSPWLKQTATSPARPTAAQQEEEGESQVEEEEEVARKSREASITSSHYVSSHEQLASGIPSPSPTLSRMTEEPPFSANVPKREWASISAVDVEKEADALSEGQVDPHALQETASLPAEDALLGETLRSFGEVDPRLLIQAMSTKETMDDFKSPEAQHFEEEEAPEAQHVAKTADAQHVVAEQAAPERKSASPAPPVDEKEEAIRSASPSLLDRLQAIMTAHQVTLSSDTATEPKSTSRSPSSRRVRVSSSEEKKSILKKTNHRLSSQTKPPFVPGGIAASRSVSPAKTDRTNPHDEKPVGPTSRSPSTVREVDVGHGYDLREEYLKLRDALQETRKALNEAQMDVKTNQEALHRTSIHLQDERTMRHAAEQQADTLQQTMERYRYDQRLRDEEIEALRADVTQLRAQLKQAPATHGEKSPAHASQLAALQKEMTAQEMLIRGYQLENEKVVQELRDVQRQRKAQEAEYATKMANLQRELMAAKVQVETRAGREQVVEQGRLEQIKSEMEFVLRTSAEREAQLKREVQVEKEEVETLRRQIITMVDSKPEALHQLQEESAQWRQKAEMLPALQKEVQALKKEQQAHAEQANVVAQLREQIKQLQTQQRRTSLKRPPMSSTESLAEQKKEEESAKAKREEEQKAKKEHEKALQALKKALSQAESQIATLSAQLETLKANEQSRAQDALQQSKALDKSKAQEMEKKEDLSKKDKAILQAALRAKEKAETELKEVQSTADGLRADMATLQEELDVSKAQVSQLTAQLSAAKRAPSPARALSPVRGEEEERLHTLQREKEALEKELAVSNARAVAVHETTIALLQKSSETVSKTALAHSEQALQWLKDHDAHERDRFEQHEISRYRAKVVEDEAQIKVLRDQVRQYEREMATWRIGLADLGIAVRPPDATGEATLPFDVGTIRLRMDAIKEENERLQAELKVARSAHTPTMHHYEQLMTKFEKIEDMYRRRERAMREMIFLQNGGGENALGGDASKLREENLALKSQIKEWEQRYQKLMASKNTEIGRFRQELDDVIDALKHLQT